MTEPSVDIGGLRREWLAACVILIVGLAASIGAFFLLDLKPETRAAGAEGAAGQSVATASPPATETPAQQFCSTTLSIAENYGVVPSGAKRLSDPQRTDVKGRYVCVANGGSLKYVISVDLVCRDLGDEHCFDLYSVTQDDGTVLFQRQG